MQMVRHDPPLIACTIGPWDYSYQALAETGECVISVPTADMYPPKPRPLGLGRPGSG
ncbi:flavin reductase [Streptomyces sp. NPDC020681]|uniref:flavin reductase n=1 Tax=Streptomyces sp. NPDC020681 TaxID=3365083 RepID=UPI00379B9666